MRTSIVLALAVAALLGPLPMALGQAPPGTGVKYELIIDCPGVTAATGGNAAVCPEQAVDAQDQMGDPTIAVDPLKPSDLIIGSLHGGSSCSGAPSVKSRCGQVFTTFTSTDHGASWFDSPYVPPSDIGGNAFGQTTGLTIDPYGHVYVGSLYAIPEDGQGQHFNYTIAAQKFASIQTIQEQQDGAYNAEYIKPVFDGNAIHQMWFLFNPATDNMTMVWNEQVTPYSTGRAGGPVGNGTSGPSSSSGTTSSHPSNSTSSTSHSSSSSGTSTSASSTTTSSSPSASAGGISVHLPASLGGLTARIGLFGFTLGGSRSSAPAAPSPRLPADGKPHSVIGVVWTNSSLHSGYHYQPQKWVLGPCKTSTNPVLSDGYLYVGCVADTKDMPFPWDPKAADGTVEMFRMDPNGGQPHWLGGVPILGGQPKLGVRSDGRLSLVSAQATKDGALDLWTVFGHYDNKTAAIQWSKLTDYGAKIDQIDPATRIMDAQVQSVIYREYSGVIQFILKERVAPQGVGLTTAKTTVGPHLRKMLVAIDETYGVLARFNLDIGNPLNRTDPTLLQADEMAYDDLTDSFLQLPEGPYAYQGKSLGDLYAREFFAVGDYGIVQFAEVIELTTLRGPEYQPPPPPPPPTPAPAASSSAIGTVVPVTGLTMVGALSLSMIATKRKQAALLRAKK